jgi:hypothetical protein
MSEIRTSVDKVEVRTTTEPGTVAWLRKTLADLPDNYSLMDATRVPVTAIAIDDNAKTVQFL